MRKLIIKTPDARFHAWREAVGTVAWSGDYLDRLLRHVLPLHHDAVCLLILDTAGRPHLHHGNMLCVRADGSVVWTAEAPSTFDVFMGVNVDAAGLIAWTSDSWQMRIDADTGKILDRVWTN